MRRKFFKNLSVMIFVLGVFIVNSCSITEALTIMLDPGHGLDNVGAFFEYDGTVIEEKNLNFKTALFLKEELSKYKTKDGKNIKVYLTRGEFENPSLEERILSGASKNADVVVSLHNNESSDASRNHRGAMMLVTCSHFNDKFDIEKNLGCSILSELKKIGINFAHDLIDGRVFYEGGLLRRPATDGFTYPNGEIADYYGIIQHGILNNIPAIIVEHAYLDNEEDYRTYLCTDDKLQRLAVADAKGIANYYGLVLKSETTKNDIEKEVTKNEATKSETTKSKVLSRAKQEESEKQQVKSSKKEEAIQTKAEPVKNGDKKVEESKLIQEEAKETSECKVCNSEPIEQEKVEEVNEVHVIEHNDSAAVEENDSIFKYVCHFLLLFLLIGGLLCFVYFKVISKSKFKN